MGAVDAPGSADDAVLRRSVAESRVLLTFDKDFGELVFLRGADASAGVILFRIPLPSPSEGARMISAAVASRLDWPGFFSVVEPGRIRMRQL
jgi:predicted nuclease of predicted toxin-antitoxin system